MSVKIRLQRHGKKGKPFYQIVVANSTAKRDGKYIEKIGSYNPNTNPASINLDVDKAVKWLDNGAQPTDTARAILSYKGALYKKHLMRGVKKGAFDMAEAEKRFEKWLSEKEAKINSKIDGLNKSKEDDAKKRFAAEVEANENRAKAIAEKNTPEVEATEEAVEEAPAAETEENTEE